IDKETVANAFESNDLDEVRTAKALIAKKYGDISDMEYESRIKMVKSIMSKGFSYTVAKEAIKG
ncbi:MAG: RecX family transcriptional regulator, partial [Lachnospiraceae bacterium]|nr:RecX family transcriptional regulator [Lachnospiraceae bacterium]